MPVPLEQFVKQIEDSGVLAGDTLKDFLPPKTNLKDGEELAHELVRKKKLTKYQAQELYKGKGKSLVLGNYTIQEKIGAGGMGQVFKAEHRRMHRVVAIKLLPTGLMKDPAVIARFEREVTAAARLNHPNIVTAFDADKVNGVHFLVMECVEGSDLAALVKKNGPFPVEQALNYILQAARGLEAAHAEGIVHRDIKPANLLLDKKGTVKILDMGLARIGGEAPGQAELTSTGTIMGTVDYMAPEQALNTKGADARADIYSLGCSLYYLLTGKATYDGDTLMAKLLAHRDQPIPSIREARPDVPEQIEAVFSRMVAKRVEDRYQTIGDVIADLSRLASRQAPSANPQPSSGSLPDTGLSDFLKDISLAPAAPARRKKAAFDKDWIHKNKKSLRVGGGVLGALALLAGIVISLRTKEGTLVLTVNEPDAEVQVLSEEDRVEITRKGEKGSLTISVEPGKHHLKVQKDGFEIFTDNFEVKSGDKTTITAKLKRKGNKPDKSVVESGKPQERPSETAASGWVSLFNGKDLAGWTGDVGLMTVENGVLAVDDGKSGTVIAPGDYQDVEVEIEFRLENRGNSGLGICYSGEGRSSQNGLEIQMLDDDGYPGVKNVQKCGSVFSLAPAKPGHFKRWPAWNSMRVTSTDSIVRVELNGVPVTDTTRQLMQQVNPQHGGIMRTSGKLCLLPNTGRSEYRNFRVRKTSDSALASASADRPERGRTTTPASASPGDALQGNWVAVGVEEANGRPLPGITEKRYVFNDRKLIMTRKSNGVPGKYEGTFTVDAAAGHFDFSGVGPAGKPVAWRGIYKRDGDSLTLCYKYVKDDSTIRPTEFRTDDKEKTPFVLVKLQRDPQASPRQGPPQDASRFKGHAYKFFPEVLTWHEAKSRCEEIGGHLAIISSAAENNFVAELAKQGIPQWGNKDGVWLGATDEKQEGDWRWIDEQSLGFKAWGRGQPNNKDNNEHYLMLYLAEGNWSDQPAKSVQHTVYFVCEWETAR